MIASRFLGQYDVDLLYWFLSASTDASSVLALRRSLFFCRSLNLWHNKWRICGCHCYFSYWVESNHRFVQDLLKFIPCHLRLMDSPNPIKVMILAYQKLSCILISSPSSMLFLFSLLIPWLANLCRGINNSLMVLWSVLTISVTTLIWNSPGSWLRVWFRRHSFQM